MTECLTDGDAGWTNLEVVGDPNGSFDRPNNRLNL